MPDLAAAEQGCFKQAFATAAKGLQQMGVYHKG